MDDGKEVSTQIHEFHMLINDLNTEEIVLPEPFVVGSLIEKLWNSWKNYKNSMKHTRKYMNLEDIIVHIRIEKKNRQRDKIDKAKEITSKANVVENCVQAPQNNKK
ncbi:hypothetical protein ACOSP7_022615 [Xanthoceras sorbifolium]